MDKASNHDKDTGVTCPMTLLSIAALSYATIDKSSQQTPFSTHGRCGVRYIPDNNVALSCGLSSVKEGLCRV